MGGKNKTLYIQTVTSIEEKTRANLKLTLTELGLEDGFEVVVADSFLDHISCELGPYFDYDFSFTFINPSLKYYCHVSIY